jgi:hypothetical protein
MYCSKCGKENQEDSKFCSLCNSELLGASSGSKDITVKTSRLAIVSFILALISFVILYIFFIERINRGRDENLFILFLWLITSLSAIILGVISLIQIGLSAGRLAATGFAVIGTALPFSFYVLLMFIAILRPVRMVGYAHRMVCGSNLSSIGKAMLIYANDYEDELPRAGGKSSKWGYTPNWQADNRQAAFNLEPDGSGGQASISSSLYLLVKYAEVMPKSFICNKDTGTTEFKPGWFRTRGKKLVDFWDFGPEPWKHCSYSYHIPYGLYALNSSCEPGMAVAADRNPWIASPAAKAKTPFSKFKPDMPPWNGTKEQANYGNAIAHKGEGQSVLFMDMHVDFQKRSYCGIEDDNIYTFLPSGLGHPEIGEPPVPFVSQPGSKEDSLLVNEPPVTRKK